jgi:hypothetical protein
MALGTTAQSQVPDSDPEYLPGTPAYVQFVLLPRGGWPDPSQNDPSFETLRFGAPRIISLEAGEAYIEGDILVATRKEMIAREVLTRTLGALIRVEAGETGADAMHRVLGMPRSDSLSMLAGLQAELLSRATDTISLRAGTDSALARDASEELVRLLKELAAAKGPQILSTTASLGKRWPDPMNKPIPYTTKNVPSHAQSWIEPALDVWRSVGIKFQQVPDLPQETSGLSFENGSGCSSYVGMKGGRQPIRLAPGCKKAVVHEIGHALGLFHEQSHPERDQFVTIRWANIKPGAEHNFAIKQNPGRTTAYDYGSIMHYSATAFSRNGKPTITPKDMAARIGQRERLSPLDIQGIKLLYASSP